MLCQRIPRNKSITLARTHSSSGLLKGEIETQNPIWPRSMLPKNICLLLTESRLTPPSSSVDAGILGSSPSNRIVDLSAREKQQA
jgi:hypothetical protein